MRRIKKKYVVGAVLLMSLMWFLAPFLIALSQKSASRMFVEGFSKDLNYRDVFASVNKCQQRPLLKEGLLFRANRYFSGWSCDKVGSPDTILSLNYDPKKPDEHYCVQDDLKPMFGIHLNKNEVMSETDFYNFLDNPRLLTHFCSYTDLTLQNLVVGKRTLIHCSAGRDRTGVMSGLLSALFLEKDLTVDSISGLLECDYKKTKKLNPEKYGTIASIYQAVVQGHGSVESFLTSKCKISSQKISGAYKSVKI